ncbi:MAG TPA: LysM peptidoglycan-binding domain-containing protein [Longimicrobiales bacterium]
MTQRRAPLAKPGKHHRNSKAALTGTLLVTVSLLTAWAVGRDDPASEAAPMDEVLAATTSKAAVSWDLPVTRNDRVDSWIDFLKGENFSKTDRWLERSGRYVPLVQAELKRRGMPQDLIYLAFIESGYNPNAHSHAAAVGLWQFISDTGRRYGLEVSSYVDERRDPFKSTKAALDYLGELHDRFGSWYLAAAAYNTGENRVARIMRERTGSEHGADADFWKIARYLPEETRNYVPLMLAAGHIGKEPDKYGFDDVDYQAPLAFATVQVPGDVPLAAVARAVGAAPDTVALLNPELVRQQTPPKRAWDVRIPVGTEQQFTANFPTALREVRLASAARGAASAQASTRYRVKRGETLSGIASRFGVTVKSIVQANGGLLASRLQIGQSIRIPKAASQVASASRKSTSRYHLVRRGDNLSRIADRYDVSVTRIKALNGLHSSRLQPGQKLRVS